MTDAKGGISPGFHPDHSWFNEASPDLLDSAADWLLAAAQRVQDAEPQKNGYQALALGAVAAATIARLRRESGDG